MSAVIIANILIAYLYDDMHGLVRFPRVGKQNRSTHTELSEVLFMCKTSKISRLRCVYSIRHAVSNFFHREIRRNFISLSD